MVLQSQSLTTSLTNKALVKRIENDNLSSSVQALLYPTLAEAFLNVLPDDGPKLNGTPTEATVSGQKIAFSLQDVAGLVDIHRTAEAVAQKHLTPADFEALLRIREMQQPETGFRQSLARANAPAHLSLMLTDASSQDQLNLENLSIRMPAVEVLDNSMVAAGAPKLLRVEVE